METTITNNEVVKYVRAVASNKGEEFGAIINRLLEKAVKDAQYRARRNATQWAQTKALKERAEELEARVKELEGVE
jgi:hypothetical protein